MKFAISTRWNASRHTSGEEMIDELLSAGADHMELGYDTRIDLLPGIEAKLSSGEISICSVHNYCPVPMGVLKGHPELWTFAALDKHTHELAVQHTLRTLQFASEMGASLVVIHCGYAPLRRTSTYDLMEMIALNQQNTARYDKVFMKFIKERDKRAAKHLEQVMKALEFLLPHAEQLNVQLGLENLPTLEAVPNEGEMELLVQQFPSPYLKYWHDLGHGQIRENLGFINHLSWMERLAPVMGGMHLHDVANRLQDHTMPPFGEFGLQRFAPFASDAIPMVLEPSNRATFEEVSTGLAWIRHWWDDAPEPEQKAEVSGQMSEEGPPLTNDY
jgi:sugar phosphate isomerase/epimerase